MTDMWMSVGLSLQSPYIKLTLHDGTLSEDSWFPGWNEVERTTGKVHNDGYVEFNEHFRLNKPGIVLKFLIHDFVLSCGCREPALSSSRP